MFRRYSEFCKLDRQLREGGWGGIKLSLPNKRWFNNLSKTVVKQRQEALQAYLNALLHYVSPEECPPLNDFFSTVPNPAAHLMSPPLSPTVEPKLMTLAEATVQFGLLPPPQHEMAARKASASSKSKATRENTREGSSFASATNSSGLFDDVNPDEGLFD